MRREVNIKHADFYDKEEITNQHATVRTGTHLLLLLVIT